MDSWLQISLERIWNFPKKSLPGHRWRGKWWLHMTMKELKNCHTFFLIVPYLSFSFRLLYTVLYTVCICRMYCTTDCKTLYSNQQLHIATVYYLIIILYQGSFFTRVCCLTEVAILQWQWYCHYHSTSQSKQSTPKCAYDHARLGGCEV